MYYNRCNKRDNGGTGGRALRAVLLAVCLFASGCAGQADTFVEIDAGVQALPASDDGTFVAIDGYSTPAPVVTPAPTAPPTPTPEPTQRPREEEPEQEREEDREEQRQEEEDDDKEEREEEKPEATPEPTEKPKQSTPYSQSYTKVDLDYESGGSGISFESTTLSGEGVSDRIFGRADITMVNIWTRT